MDFVDCYSPNFYNANEPRNLFIYVSSDEAVLFTFSCMLSKDWILYKNGKVDSSCGRQAIKPVAFSEPEVDPGLENSYENYEGEKH